jgi:hypothetical protein
MAGLVPAIHVLFMRNQDVDARHKAGHDEPAGRATALNIPKLQRDLRQFNCATG